VHWSKVPLSLFAAQYSDFTCLWMSSSSFNDAFIHTARYFTWFKKKHQCCLFAFCYYLYLKAHMMIFKKFTAFPCCPVDYYHQNCYNRSKSWFKTIHVSKYHKGSLNSSKKHRKQMYTFITFFCKLATQTNASFA